MLPKLITSLPGCFLATAFLVSTTVSGVEADTSPETIYGPGVAEIEVFDIRADRPLTGNIWYPTNTPDRMQQADKSKVWEMALADPDGTPAKGPFPLLVVSHGMYGNTFNQAWLGSELSRRGFVVAMVNHPGTSTFLRDKDQARQLWDRPKDLSRLISYLTGQSDYSQMIDAKRIYAAGHSLGGFTVMLSAGAQFDSDQYRKACDVTDPPVACGVLKGWSVAETPEDKVAMQALLKDPRISKVISMDLGGTPVLSRSSLAAVDIPILVLGSERADMLNQDVESRELAGALPEKLAKHVELKDAGHFDFMGKCKPEGFSILEEHEPGDEIVCIKGTDERAQQHRRIVEEILKFLGS